MAYGDIRMRVHSSEFCQIERWWLHGIAFPLKDADDQKELIMKSFVFTIVAASALAMPIAAFSQTDGTVTRAQVRAELQQLEQAGYDPAKGENPNYPADIQAAEALKIEWPRVNDPRATKESRVLQLQRQRGAPS